MAAAAAWDASGLPDPVTREEIFWKAKATGNTDSLPEPITRRELYLCGICDGSTAGLPDPATREEIFLLAAAAGSTEGLPEPVTREEHFLRAIAEGGGGAGGEFGVEWDYSSSSPVLTRTGDAAGFSDPVPATSLAGTGSSPFDGIMPWAGMRMCNLIDGQVVWQGDPQFSETEHDTMVFIPEFWYKAEKDTAARKCRWSVSPTEREGYAKHPGSGRYVGRFHVSGTSSVLRSVSGASPIVSTKKSVLMASCRAKGAKMWMVDYATVAAVQLLYLVEFANFNSQLMLGFGNDTGAILATGLTSGAAYHTLKGNSTSNAYRWIENPFSNVYSYIDGIMMSTNAFYLGLDNASFSATTLAGLTKTEYSCKTYGYQTALDIPAAFPFAFLPTAVGGSATTYTTDSIWLEGGTRNCLHGGGINKSYLTSYGMFCLSFEIALDSANAVTSTRLIFIP